MTAPRRSPFVAAAVAALVLALALQLTLAASRNSATFDEPAHIYAGHLQWAHGYFTLNPPLTRYLIAAPLLGLPLVEPPIGKMSVRGHEMAGGRDFVFKNDTETIMFRSRMAVVALTVLLALLVFAVAAEMFGAWAGVIALAVLAFDPTLLAHSSVATTDTGQALFILWAVYAFYAYVRHPTAWRLAACGLVVGLAFAAKTSTVQLLPIFGLLALAEVAWGRRMGCARPEESTGRQAGRFALALVVITAIAITVLWASYGFRYMPADGGFTLNPPMTEKLATVPSPLMASLLGFADRHHLLPQAYTYGFAHFLYEARAFSSYLGGTVYPHAVWYFFPVAAAVKSTLSFLLLLVIGAFAIATGRVSERRGMLYLVVPAAVYLLVAMLGGANIGIRHILPVYVLLTVAIGGAAWGLVERSRRWLALVVVLLVFQAASVLHAFPGYIAYANEAFGGPSNAYRYVSDSSADWGQQLKSVRQYLDQRGIRDCYFAYFGQGPLDFRSYGIPCKPLPTAVAGMFTAPPDVPPTIDGIVLMSAGTLTGFEYGPAPLNPYESFKSLQPVDMIDNGVFVFKGRFDVPLASAISHVQKAGRLRAKNPQAALDEARQAEALAPESVTVLMSLGQMLEANRQPDEATACFRKALALAEANRPEFQEAAITSLRKRLGVK